MFDGLERQTELGISVLFGSSSVFMLDCGVSRAELTSGFVLAIADDGLPVVEL